MTGMVALPGEIVPSNAIGVLGIVHPATASRLPYSHNSRSIGSYKRAGLLIRARNGQGAQLCQRYVNRESAKGALRFLANFVC